MNISTKSGNTVPDVNPAELYDTITGCVSQDPATLSQYQKRLEDLLKLNGAYDALHDIGASRNIQHSVRHQALIQFKNAALNHWRSRKVLSEEHKAKIRIRALTFLDDESDTLTKIHTHIVSKLARQDYPAAWPTIIDDLMGAIEVNLQQRYSTPSDDPRSSLIIKRSLQYLNGILKELAGVKMLNGIKNMTQVYNKTHLTLYGYYSKISSLLSATPSDPHDIFASERAFHDLAIATLLFKALARLAGWKWTRLGRTLDNGNKEHDDWFESFFKETAIQFTALVKMRSDAIMSGRVLNPQSLIHLTKLVHRHGKFFRKLSTVSHPRFVTLPMCNDLVLFYWGQVVQATSGPPELIQDSADALFPTRFLIPGILLLKENLPQWAPVKKDGSQNPNALSPDFIRNATQMVVTRFLPLTPSDLEAWTNDPEGWFVKEETEVDHIEFEVRAAAERLMITLGKEFPSYVTTVLLDMYNRVSAQPSTTLEAVLQKEALYCAIGRCSTRLKDVIPFEQWLQQTLLPESQETSNNAPLLKRRIAWLLGKWVVDNNIPPTSNIWGVLVPLLTTDGAGTDLVVKLTAAVAIKDCVASLEFTMLDFTPHLPAVINTVVDLVADLDELSTKRLVDGTINAIIEHSEDQIIPFVDVIVAPLPQLWTAAGNDWEFKKSLLSTVTNLVKATKAQSLRLATLIIPLVQESLSKAAEMQLDEGGLELWETAVRHTTSVEGMNGGPGLLTLFPDAVKLLGTNMDLLGKTTNIVESYFLVAADQILQHLAVPLFTSFTAAFKLCVDMNQRDMLASLNILFQVSPSNLWAEAMHTSGLFAQLFNTLADSKTHTRALTDHILLLSRLVLSDKNMFVHLISVSAPTLGTTEDALYTCLLDQWWARFDNMSEARHRKLCAIGIAALVSTGQPKVLERLTTEIFNLWLDVFGEIKEAEERAAESEIDNSLLSPGNLRRYWELDEPPHDYFRLTEGSAEYDRRMELYNRDPVRTVKLTQFVGQQLQEVEQRLGPQTFHDNVLSKADPTVLKQIQDALRS